MEIDIRNPSDEEVNVIRFSTHDVIRYEGSMIEIVDERDHPVSYTAIYKKDIDNLILALQKSQELWGDE